MSMQVIIIKFTHAWGLQFISEYDLKPLQQIFLTDSNVNFPFDNNFLYQLFCNFDLKMSNIGRQLTFPYKGFQ